MSGIVKAIGNLFGGDEPEMPEIPEAEDPKVAPDPDDKAALVRGQRRTASRYAAASTVLQDDSSELG